jgi:hypothetical protein
MFNQIAQVTGALLILCAYGALQGHRLHAKQMSYLLLNLIGSAILAVLALIQRQWGFLLLEGVWAAVSALAIITAARARWRRRDGPLGDRSTTSDAKSSEFIT